MGASKKRILTPKEILSEAIKRLLLLLLYIKSINLFTKTAKYKQSSMEFSRRNEISKYIKVKNNQKSALVSLTGVGMGLQSPCGCKPETFDSSSGAFLFL